MNKAEINKVKKDWVYDDMGRKGAEAPFRRWDWEKTPRLSHGIFPLSIDKKAVQTKRVADSESLQPPAPSPSLR
ncbi:MAG: hypothetical protein K0S08_908 [Gammaproteobacteria bacterium]|jgi:hypothetical protein|nr:hypothetical protein [Gammaproteobacteria bacterium]